MQAPTQKTVSTPELSRLLGIPERTLASWKTAGIIRPVRCGRWAWPETLIPIIEHLRTGPRASAREEVLTAQAEWKRLQVSILAGDHIPRTDAEWWISSLNGTFKSELLGLGSRLTGVLAHVESPAEIRWHVDAEARAILTRLSALWSEIGKEAGRLNRKR